MAIQITVQLAYNQEAISEIKTIGTVVNRYFSNVPGVDSALFRLDEDTAVWGNIKDGKATIVLSAQWREDMPLIMRLFPNYQQLILAHREKTNAT